MKQSNTSFGIKDATALTAKDDIAPKPTRVFMLGEPLTRLFNPSRISLLPGAAKANIESAKWNGVEWNAWTHEGALDPKKWEACPKRHTAHNAHETASSWPEENK